MHVSPDRFDLDAVTERRLDDFRELIWHNSELCNECFTQIREIDRTQADLAPSSTRNLPEQHHDRTEDSVAEWPGFFEDPPTDRYGTTFCRECGSESGSRWVGTRSVSTVREHLVRILRYTADETEITVRPKAADAELRDLKTGPDARDRQGRDLQCIAVAWARSVVAAPVNETDKATV